MSQPNGAAVMATVLPSVLLLLAAAASALIGWRRPGLPVSFHRWLASIGLLGAAGAALITLHGLIRTSGLGLVAFSGAVVADRFAVYAQILLCVVALLGMLGAGTAVPRLGHRTPAFHALVLTATAGGTVIAVQWEMGVLVAGVGLLVLSLVAIVALEKTAGTAGEAALKQLAGAGAAVAVLAYGLAMVFGATGTTDLAATRDLFIRADSLEGLGLAMTLLGLCCLVGAAPLHQWMLQVAKGSSGALAAVAVSLGATAGGIALVRAMVSGFGATLRPWVVLAAVVAAAACLYPALLALTSAGLRRLIGLGVSVQGGLLVAALLGSGIGGDGRPAGGVVALLFALGVFALAALASFQAVGLLDAQGIGTEVAQLKGLTRRAPGTALILTLGLAGLAGLPPLATFIARLLIAEASFAGGYAWVAVVSLAAWVIYAVAVLRCLTNVFVEDDDAPVAAPITHRLARVVATCCAVSGVLASIVAGPILYAAQGAALSLR
jgi:NADH-quinone oxidoreductase subunit N